MQESKGSVDHADARYLGNDKWSLWVRPQGEDAINHICYLANQPIEKLSPIAKLILDPTSAPRNVSPKVHQKRLA
jgi:hypothetical protein